MQITVIKRDGQKEPFKVSKIKNAVRKCCLNSGITENLNSYLDSMMTRFPTDLSKDDEKEFLMDVEQIQEWVISDLYNYYSKEASINYSKYREAHSKIRDAKYNKKFYDIILSLVNLEDSDVSQENANKNAKQNNVVRDLMAGETSKKFVRQFYLDNQIKEYHDKGLMHIHDLDYRIVPGITNCGLINLLDILKNGTVINDKLIESPTTLKTAATIATQVSLAVANTQYGGQTMSLAHLAPWVQKSKSKLKRLVCSDDKAKNLDETEIDSIVDTLLRQEIKDSIQTLNYQWNSFVSTNGQAPFISVWMQVSELEGYEEETAMLIEEMLRQRLEGMKSPTGDIIGQSFPKLLLGLEEAIMDKKSEYYYISELAAECITKRMSPDLVSIPVMKSLKEGGVYPHMGCRSSLTPLIRDGKHQAWGRCNLGVISLNIPYVALESNTEEEYFSKLSEYAEFICKQQFTIAKRIASSSTDGAPILWQYGAFARLPKGSKIGDLINNIKGYSTISLGYSGIAEACARFGINYVSEEGHKFAEKTLKTLSEVTEKWKSQTPYDYSLYGTPSESLTTKFAKSLKRFKKIAGVNDHDYVTNSYHIPVTTEIDAFSKIKFESSLQGLTAGGSIEYVEVPDVSKNPECILNLMRYIYNTAMYCEINTTSCDVCYKCGYQGNITMHDHNNFECPNCGNTDRESMYILRRLCGYLGSLSTGTTLGRWKDIQDRVKHL